MLQHDPKVRKSPYHSLLWEQPFNTGGGRGWENLGRGWIFFFDQGWQTFLIML